MVFSTYGRQALPRAKASSVGSSLGPLAPPGSLVACPQLWSSPLTTLPFIIPQRVTSVPTATLADTVVSVWGLLNRVLMPRTTVTMNSPRSEPRFARPWPRDSEDFRILWRSQKTREMLFDHPGRAALRIPDEEKSDAWDTFRMRQKNWFGNVFSVSDVGLTIWKAKSKKRQGRQQRFIAVYLIFITTLLKKYFILPTLQMRKSEKNNFSKDPARRKGPGTKHKHIICQPQYQPSFLHPNCFFLLSLIETFPKSSVNHSSRNRY